MISHSGFLCKTKVQQGVELSFIFNGQERRTLKSLHWDFFVFMIEWI